jgi:hypothetical protein
MDGSWLPWPYRSLYVAEIKIFTNKVDLRSVE